MYRPACRVIAALAFLAGPTLAGAQTVRGRVVETGTDEPVRSATVLLLKTNGDAVADLTADGDGVFAVDLAHGGSYDLRVRRFGYETVEGTIQVAAPDTLVVEILLSPSAVAVEPVVVSARPVLPYLEQVGFHDRARSGAGHFITADEIEARHPARLSDLMHGITGVQVLPSGNSFFRDVGMRGTATLIHPEGYCRPKIMLDGIVARAGGYPRATPGEAPTLDEIMVPQHVAALEIYPGVSSIPTRFGATGSACGVIAIWTKRQAPG